MSYWDVCFTKTKQKRERERDDHCSSSKRRENLVVCLHTKGINLVNLVKERGTHTLSRRYKIPSLESLDSSHVGWGGGRKVGNKKSIHLKLSPSSAGNYFGSQNDQPVMSSLPLKTCLDHHCRNDSVPCATLVVPGSTVRTVRYLTTLGFLWFIHVTLF